MTSPPADVPPILYKYVNADRLEVLTNCHIRFSQRTVFQDDHELQPDYDAYGTIDQIEKQIQLIGRSPIPWMPPRLLARLIAFNPRHQRNAIEAAVKNIQSIHKMGILCLTVTPHSDRMWKEYASDGSGFVVGFDTNHDGFRSMTAPLGVRRVTYNSQGFPTFLGMMDTDVFEPLWRKRMEYAHEQEWRSIRLLRELVSLPNEVFLAPFDPHSICEIFIGPDCHLEAELRRIAGEERYRHARLEKSGWSST